MKEKTVTLNPCQDCGCSPGQLLVASFADDSHEIYCPYCGRSSGPIWMENPRSYDILILLAAKWNTRNPAFEGGLI